MKVFNFRLETLLHLREITRDKALGNYAKAINVRQEKEKALQESRSFLEELQLHIGQKRRDSFSGSSEESFDLSVKTAKERIIDAHKNLQQSLQSEAAKKRIYLKADSEYKSLLKLKEKQMEEHVRTQSLKEERELEDIIGGRFVFNNISN
jgi:flagellar export protein FliJ